MTVPTYDERVVLCPECGAERATRATPNTRLRCRGCGGSFLAPRPGETAAPADDAAEPEPAAAAEPEPVPAGGVTIIEADRLELGRVPVAPAGENPPPDPEPEPAAAPADPAPADPVIERVRRGGRGRRPVSRRRDV